MKKLVFISLVSIAVVAVVLMLFLQHSAEQETGEVVSVDDSKLSEQPLLSEEKAKQKTLASSQVESEIEEEYNPYESEVFKGQVNLVADKYQELAKYPIGSQPIKNAADARQPEPFEETEVGTPFETESGETISVSAAVDRFQYFTNDIINVRLVLGGVPEGDSVNAIAVLAGRNGDTPLSVELQPASSSQQVLIGAFDTSIAPPSVFSEEMIAKISVTVGGEPFLTTVSFNYTAASAKLVGLGFVKPNNANLEIPFEYTVFSGGYYFVNAVLTDEQTGRPLITLQTEGRMPQGNGRLIAKAHIQALKAAGSEGPYILTNIKAYRGAEQGEQFDSPASTIQPEYDVTGYAFSEYQDEEYIDPLAQERVDFLRKLGQVENENN